MPFQLGNDEWKKGAKSKPVRDALRLEVATANEDREDYVPPRSLRAIARAQLRKAAEGDIAAFREIADRLDGKPAQAIVGDADEDAIQVAIQKIERVIVRPSDTDG